ncbi:MAG: hypothetical protein H7Y06_03250 [Opitutaceae bacterium]|nr:hypothetical protein [Opitutaceae bacterium]
MTREDIEEAIRSHTLGNVGYITETWRELDYSARSKSRGVKLKNSETGQWLSDGRFLQG